MNDEVHGTERPDETGTVPQDRPLRVLVVDDDADVGCTIVRALEHLGHKGIRCGHAQEALDALAAQSFDLLLVDYRMPDMTGLDLIALLRHDGCKIPAIMMTGHFATEDRMPGEQLGICALLRKPLTLPMLARVLGEPLMVTREPA
jgi:CheY-like chemotaxis protein